MAANRALVVPNSQSFASAQGPVTAGENSVYFVLDYVILDSNSNAVASAGNGLTVVSLQLNLTYENINNVVGAIQSAVRANENDSSLQVYVV